MAETPGEKLIDDAIDADGDDWAATHDGLPLRQIPAGRSASVRPLRQRIEDLIERRRLERALDERIDDDWLR
jgi:hypothetical protein